MFGYRNIGELNASPPQEHYTPEYYADFLRRKANMHVRTTSGRLECDIIRTDGAVRNLQLSSKNVFGWQAAIPALFYNDIPSSRRWRSHCTKTNWNTEPCLRLRMMPFCCLPTIIGLTATQQHWVSMAALGSRSWLASEQILTSNAARWALFRRGVHREDQSCLHGWATVFWMGTLSKDGTLFSAEVSLNRLDIDGKPYMQSIVRDITERKKTETALLASEERFRLLAENALVGVYILQDGKYLYANPRNGSHFWLLCGRIYRHDPAPNRAALDHAMVDKNIQRRIDGEVKDFSKRCQR